MLQITIPALEKWDEVKQEFIYEKEQTLKLEHSLVSLSKWESTWKKPFLTNKPITPEEDLDYARCMTVTQNVDPSIYHRLTIENLKDIRGYIDDPMTATTFSDEKEGKGGHEIITSELIYYWMVAYQIPSEYQKWHLNRLLTLIRVCNIKNAPPKKKRNKDILLKNHALNEARKKQLNTKG